VEKLTLWAGNAGDWHPLVIDMGLLQRQKEWLYAESKLMPRSNADATTNRRDADMIDGMIEMLECIQDVAEILERKEVKNMEEKTVEMKDIAGRDVGDETLECDSCGRFFGADQVLDKGTEEKYPETGAKGQCPACGGLVYVKKFLDAKIAGDAEKKE